MPFNTLFTIVLKILGLYFIRFIIELVPQFIALKMVLFEEKADTVNSVILYVAYFALLAVYLFTFYLFVFKSEKVIGWLKLDKGFAEPRVELNMHRSSILSIAVIIIGGLLVINEIPVLGQRIFLHIQALQTPNSPKPSFSPFIVPGIKIVLGILLMAEQRRIVKWVEWKRRRIQG